MNKQKKDKPSGKKHRWLWFIGLYLSSLTLLFLVSFGLKLLFPHTGA